MKLNKEEKTELSPQDGKTGCPEEVHDKLQDVRSETPVCHMQASDVKEETEINKSEIAIVMEVHHHPHAENKSFKKNIIEK